MDQPASAPRSTAFLHSRNRRKLAFEPRAWLIPGESSWEIWAPASSNRFHQVRSLGAEETDPLPDAVAVALPATLVTCQLFWLMATDDKSVPDLVRMQCERRLLLRQDEVWAHSIIRREAERVLVQVLILQNAIPPVLEVEGPARFEAQARCLNLPPRAACVWRSLGSVSLALTDGSGAVYFQSLPHRSLTQECLRDVQSILLLAQAQDWVEGLDKLALVGDWNQLATAEAEGALGLRVERIARDQFALPDVAMELVPRSVRHLRIRHLRQHRIKLGVLAVAAVYALFLAGQILSNILTSASNARLQFKLDSVMPSVVGMQTTARQLNALNPALDVKTYPLEILYRSMAVLPEKGVRLTRFNIIGNRIEIGGESSTAREAFDYINALEAADSLNHIEWEAAPQPVPLPNDTTRFSIQGTISGAYHDPEKP